MNPFLDKIFLIDNFDSKELKIKREEFLKDKKFTINDVVEWFASNENNTLIDRLYYVYSMKLISEIIGWSKKPTFGHIDGYLSEEFYIKLYNKLDKFGQSILFPFMPGNIQTDEMLINHLKNDPKIIKRSINNYNGEKLKTSTLEWLIDNMPGTVRDWKEEWWTPKLKTKAIKKEPFIISLVPESLLTKAEIKKYLRENGFNDKKYIDQFLRNIPKSFKLDPEIFGLYTSLMDDGLTKIDYEIKKELKKEHYIEYLKNISDGGFNSSIRYNVWKNIPDELQEDKDIITLALKNKKVATQLFLNSPDILTNNQIDYFLENFIATAADRAKIASHFKRMGKLNRKTMEKINFDYDDIEYLSKSEIKELMDSEVVDYLLDSEDKTFLSKKTNWPNAVELDNKKIAKMLELLSWVKIKARMPYDLTEDDYVQIHFLINEKCKNISLAHRMLERLVDERNINISEDTLKILKELGTEGSYEGWKSIKELFIF